jgi:hypothetical protein
MRTSLKHALALVLLCISPLPSQEKFNGCGMAGNARGREQRALNRLKNRYIRPMPEDYTRYGITLEKMLEPGDDAKRFTNSEAAEVEGYVKDVVIGGVESCNCNARDPRYRDTHIVLVLGPKDARAARTVIAEVTPRWREVMRKRGVDWSTDGLRKRLKNRWVRIRGWMLYDWYYTGESENTNPGGRKNWRATSWEIHPVISIEVLKKR